MDNANTIISKYAMNKLLVMFIIVQLLDLLKFKRLVHACNPLIRQDGFVNSILTAARLNKEVEFYCIVHSVSVF